MHRIACLALFLLLSGCAQGPSQSQDSAQIREAQEQLRALGLYQGPIDGLYGPQSRRAVSQYQSDRHIPVTARLDKPTLDALHAEAAYDRSSPVPANPAQIRPEQIRMVQMRLRQMNMYEGDVDGTWGQALQTSMENFQRSHQLATGSLDRPTLIAMGFNPDDFTPRPAADRPSPTPGSSTSLGTTSNPGRASDLIGNGGR
jgi:peptidoglycan hydrolase-like protein with peptidoglycan-binding domain